MKTKVTPERFFNMDSLKEFKEAQKQVWALFAPFEFHTTPTAARLLKHAGVQSGQRVLDRRLRP